MEFTPFTVIAGANASGKSNLFDALTLLSRLAEVDLKTAFGDQRGSPNELFTQYSEDTYATEMDFVVEMLVDRKVSDNWGGEATLNHTRMRYELTIKRGTNNLGIENLMVERERLEKIKLSEDNWCKKILPGGKEAESLWRAERSGGSKEAFIRTEKEGNTIAIKIRQDGKLGGKATPANAISQTVLGGINSVDFPHAFAAKEEMRNWKFLRLNPEDLREPTQQDAGMRDIITPSGKNLAAALFRIQRTDAYHLKEISRKLNSLLPNLTEVKVYDDKTNRQFIIKVMGEDGKEFSSRVLSEGTLRLLTLCVFQYDDQHKGLICFEEPENGVHPFRIRPVTHLLKDLSTDFSALTGLRQVIVNTHSPALVGELISWDADKTASTWFSQLNTLVTTHGGNKIKLKITKMLPVLKSENGAQFSIPFTEYERSLTLDYVERYLETADTENAN